MAIYVRRHGLLVDKQTGEQLELGPWSGKFPTPRVSRFEGYHSPIDDKWISSDRQREKDLYQSGSCDPRDLKKKDKPDAAGSGPEQLDFWRPKPD